MNKKIENAYLTKVVNAVNMFMEQNRCYYAEALNIAMTTIVDVNRSYCKKNWYNPVHHIESRVKKNESMVRKLSKKRSPVASSIIFRRIKDVAGIRIICDCIDDVYIIAALLEQSNLMLIRRRDYISRPKVNGYRSLHMVFNVPILVDEKRMEIPVEIQIRTIAMDIWGRIEHDLRYKSDKEPPEEIYRKLKQCADQLADVDKLLQELYASNRK